MPEATVTAELTVASQTACRSGFRGCWKRRGNTARVARSWISKTILRRLEREQTGAESANGAAGQRVRGRPFGSPDHDARELGSKGGSTPRTRPLRGSGIAAYADYRMRLVRPADA